MVSEIFGLKISSVLVSEIFGLEKSLCFSLGNIWSQKKFRSRSRMKFLVSSLSAPPSPPSPHLKWREIWSNHFFGTMTTTFERGVKKMFSPIFFFFQEWSEMAKKLIKSLFFLSRGPFWGKLFLFFFLLNLR